MTEKSKIPINLTWQDIQMIVAIADHLLEVLKPGEHAQKYPTDESYYSAVLDEYNRTKGNDTH